MIIHLVQNTISPQFNIWRELIENETFKNIIMQKKWGGIIFSNNGLF